MTPDELLATFHAQIRLADRDAETGHVVERDGLVHRNYPRDPAERGAMIESPEGLGDDPGAVIAAQRTFFAERGQSVEWKTYSYDEPADLPARLAAAGFEAEEVEALILGELEVLADLAESVPDGLRLRAIVADDLPRVAQFQDSIWGAGSSWVTGKHFGELAADPDHMQGCLVERVDDGVVVTASWVRLTPETQFCGLWGGSTLESYRRRGLYRASVGYRARLALARGARYVRVDASPNSRPILQRLGLHQVATTTPFVLTP
ncbi:GNAT family N-acetyltransferase [Nostocoides sp. HKS02]|uniref:GNAT family N-acetyltransferase n=1 Tax=Nostocoides sp. HKS02 TaxID=1813880 RepID=UPI0012B4AD1F|nr:GNAT family N-acetyltransferase [Tetrasphaera sp. HKS02]QGN58754.1 GNAT family N-acetyltransferase [Tetrasphaera sp. HKS02]